MTTHLPIFISYSHKNEDQLQRLCLHLAGLEKLCVISVWSDKKIDVGDKWEAEIMQAMSDAKIAVLLVTADFLASDFIQDSEIPFLRDRFGKGELELFPVIARPCAWEMWNWLQEIQVFPSDDQPVWRTGGNSEFELTQLARKIKRKAQEIVLRLSLEGGGSECNSSSDVFAQTVASEDFRTTQSQQQGEVGVKVVNEGLSRLGAASQTVVSEDIKTTQSQQQGELGVVGVNEEHSSSGVSSQTAASEDVETTQLQQQGELSVTVEKANWEFRENDLLCRYFEQCRDALSQNSTDDADKQQDLKLLNMLAEFHDQDEDKVTEYLDRAGLLYREDGEWWFTNDGALLFCQAGYLPRSIYMNITLGAFDREGARHSESIQRQSVFGARERIKNWISAQMRWVGVGYSNTLLQAGNSLDLEVLIEEALANFIIHRDYSCEDDGWIIIEPEYIEFRNPGQGEYRAAYLMQWLEEEKPDRLRPKYKHNKSLIQAFQQASIGQKLGSGLRAMWQFARRNGIYKPGSRKPGLEIETPEGENRFILRLYWPQSDGKLQESPSLRRPQKSARTVWQKARSLFAASLRSQNVAWIVVALLGITLFGYAWTQSSLWPFTALIPTPIATPVWEVGPLEGGKPVCSATEDTWSIFLAVRQPPGSESELVKYYWQEEEIEMSDNGFVFLARAEQGEAINGTVQAFVQEELVGERQISIPFFPCPPTVTPSPAGSGK